MKSESLLARIDVIVDFSRGAGGAELAGQDQGALASMVANLVRTVKPIEAHDARPEETGRILVVDDNASNRDLLFRRLSRDGHEVTRAESGRRALEHPRDRGVRPGPARSDDARHERLPGARAAQGGRAPARTSR